MGENRRYTEQEFAIILRKAMELEERAPFAPGRAEGMTLEEIQAVAREVGVDPALVSRAATLLTREEGAEEERVLRGTMKAARTLRTSRVLSPDDMSRVVSAIRRRLAAQGEVAQELTGVTWKSVGDVTQTFVTLRPDEAGTEIQLRLDRSAAFILTWFLPVAAFLAAAGALGNAMAPEGLLGGFLYFLTFLAGGLATGQMLWIQNSHLATERFKELAEAVAAEVEERPRLP